MKRNYMSKIKFIALLLFVVSFSNAQCILNCGTGADGAYLANTNTTLVGGTYNFTSFTINSGQIVTVTGTQPLIIKCTGNVFISGALVASGGAGGNGVTFSTYGVSGVGVAGGQNGSDGNYSSSAGPLNATNGYGPGAGGMGANWSGGGGAGYAVNGQSASTSLTDGIGGVAYGSPQIPTVVGGSGGAGGSGGFSCGSGGGGAGGGYISITACGSITIGTVAFIFSDGGNGGSDGTGNCGGGGGGSGGSIILMSNSTFSNMGTISAIGGTGGASNVPGSPYYGVGGNGAQGRVFVRGTSVSGSGTSNPVFTTGASFSASAVTTSNVTCFGGSNGSASATPTGGTGPYTYSWSPSGGTGSSATGLTAGFYTVTVTESGGCTTTTTATITEPPQLQSLSAVGSNPTCFGSCNGMLVGTVFGGTPSYTYLWNPGNVTGSTYSGACAGTYTLTGTDANGCMTTSTVTLTEPPQLQSIAAVGTPISCFGVCDGGLVGTVFGGTPGYVYTWNPGNVNGPTYSNVCTGTYSLTGTDANGCTTTSTVVITEPSAISISMSHVDESSAAANDGTATAIASGGTGSYNYLWTPSGQTTAVATGLDAGTYTCTVTDANGCTSTSIVTIGTMTEVSSAINSVFEINLFPNPANDQLMISVKSPVKENTMLDVYNVLGEKIDHVELGLINNLNYNYLTSKLANGIYSFSVTAGTTVATQKVTIVH